MVVADPKTLLEREFEQIRICKAGSATIFVVLHSTRLGPALGGVRRWPYGTPSEALQDALRLAEAMTRKCALAKIPGGGGKAVIMERPGMDREAAYRALGRLIEGLGGLFMTGSDVGTGPEDLAVLRQQTEHVARPESLAGQADATAAGVFAGIEAVASRLGRSGLEGATLAVQGLGEVGMRLARLLAREGGKLLVSDLRPERVEQAASELGARARSPEAILEAECDILVPCALGGVLDAQSVARLRARAVAGAANNPLLGPEQGAALFARGILYAPDFVINAGGLIHGALLHRTGEAPPASRILAIGARVGELLDRARKEKVPPEVLAEQMARARVEAGGAR